MKQFLNRKKAEPVSLDTSFPDPGRSGTPTTLPSPGLKKSQSKWKKSKKQPEPKPEINLTNVLPSADDFRTSLIMPNLSARFSMLREQDDPNSLLGKASDDSVLQPRRRSRMMDFGFAARAGALGDIAEVSSMRSSIRPPFAENERSQSFISEDGYDSDPSGGSMLSRARPGEGNTMFGGRQKVYMIPKSGSSSTTKVGKVVYEDDIKQSAFQKHKQREREAAARMADEARQFDFGLDSGDAYNEHDIGASQPYDSHQDLSHSPSLSSYDKKRSTNSSSARSEARSSTAATSVASQPTVTPQAPAPQAASMQSRPSLERSNTKARRLYEQGLDQHMLDQQSSALTRLNSIQRSRAPLGGNRAQSPYLHQTKSVNNLHDPGQRSVYAVGSTSPPPDRRPPPLKSVGSFKRHESNNGSPVSGPGSPLSPPIGDYGENDILTQALEQGDRGKATAMGAFNKPKQAFDEKQYLERQMALQRSTSNAAIRREASAPAGFKERIARYNELGQERIDSAVSNRSRSDSASKENKNSYQGSAAKNPNRSVTPSQLASFSPQINAQYPDTHRTFFGNIAASDSEEDEEERTRHDSAGHAQEYHPHNKWQPSVLPSVSEHPALRQQRSRPALVEEEDEIQRLPEVNNLKSGFDVDSPTIPTENLVVSHLRSKSNASSMYPGDEVPDFSNIPDMPANAKHLKAYGADNKHLNSVVQNELRVDSTYSTSNPWELDENANPYAEDENSQAPVSPMEDGQSYGTRIPSISPAERDLQGQSQVSQVSQESDSWQNELRKQNHNRDASNATQQERAAFDNELAARRAAIQDNIKSIVEIERNNIYQGGSGNAFKALNMLRTKSSRDSIDPKRDTKFNRMFGMNGNSSSGNSPVIGTERNPYSFEATRPRGDSGSRPRPAQSSVPPQPRAMHSEQERRDWSETRPVQGRSPPSSVNSQAARSRSNSVTTGGRSRSRTGPYRDDLEKAMIEGTGSSAAGVPDLTPFMPKEMTPQASPHAVQSPFDHPAERARSNSRNAGNGYFDGAAQPAQNRTFSSPAIQQVQAPYTSSVISARSSPAPSPYVQQTATPPLSGSSTPLNGGFSVPQQTGSRPLRKKTISKSDISEPTLISSTSTVDTVDLPAGASLKNGMAEPPPLPPINPKRKTRKIFGKSERSGSVEEIPVDRNARSKTPDPWSFLDAQANGANEQRNHHVLTPSASPPVAAPGSQLTRGFDSSSALNQYGYQGAEFGSPERQATTGATVGGGMF